MLSGAVTTVISAADGTSIYIGGDFNTVNGVNRRKVARINLSNGSLVTTFNANGVNGIVRDMRLSRWQPVHQRPVHHASAARHVRTSPVVEPRHRCTHHAS